MSYYSHIRMTANDIYKNPSLMRKLSDKGLSDFLHNHLDVMKDCQLKKILMDAFNKECSRRSAAYYESINGGEWI